MIRQLRADEAYWRQLADVLSEARNAYAAHLQRVLETSAVVAGPQTADSTTPERLTRRLGMIDELLANVRQAGGQS